VRLIKKKIYFRYQKQKFNKNKDEKSVTYYTGVNFDVVWGGGGDDCQPDQTCAGVEGANECFDGK